MYVSVYAIRNDNDVCTVVQLENRMRGGAETVQYNSTLLRIHTVG